MDVNAILGNITPPPGLVNITNNKTGAEGVSMVLSNILQLIIVLASVAFVFMIAWSAFQWITSGGDKEKVAMARSRAVQAIVGIVLLGLLFIILRVLGNITGFTFFK